MSSTDFQSSTNFPGTPVAMDGDEPVSVEVQQLYDKLLAVSRNLWWSWQPDCEQLFRDLDPIRWRQLDHNPVALLNEFTPSRLNQRAGELVLHSRINYAFRR
ncbi:MAG: DUF3417 domain-containing protein, partial [Planctomycetota bacterium]